MTCVIYGVIRKSQERLNKNREPSPRRPAVGRVRAETCQTERRVMQDTAVKRSML